jgi:hypothetical protein
MRAFADRAPIGPVTLSMDGMGLLLAMSRIGAERISRAISQS